MKILLITQYFPPEPGAPSNRMQAFVDAMVRRGHDVTVICEFPNYPSGILRKQDKWKLFSVEDKGSYRIIRTFVLTFARKNNIKRLLYYMSFALSSAIASLLVERPDVIFSSSPPIFHVIGAMFAAWLQRSKLVLDIRDLWPDAVVEIDAMSKGRFIRWASWMENKLYRDSSMIFATNQGAKNKIEQRGGQGKTQVIYNGSYESILNWTGDVDSVRKKNNWENKVVILYAGIIGLAQDINSLLPLMKRFDDKVIFQIIGNGPQKADIVNSIQKLSLKNIEVKDTVPLAELIPHLYSADLLLVVLKESNLFETTIPSKFFDYMATGKPIITNVGGEVRQIMEEYNTGIYFSVSKENSFEQAVNTLVNNPDLRQKMGENGKNLVRNRYLRSNLSDLAVKEIEKFLNKEI